MQLITIQTPDEKAIVLGLSRFANDLEDFSKFFKDRLEPLLIAGFSEIFETEGASGKAGSWAPLSLSYGKIKAKKFPGKMLLVARGDLKKMMTSDTDFVSQTFPQEYIVYTSKIGIWHQRGTSKMPARPFFSLTEEDKKAIYKNLHAWAYETWLEANKENFRSAAISEYGTKMSSMRWA